MSILDQLFAGQSQSRVSTQGLSVPEAVNVGIVQSAAQAMFDRNRPASTAINLRQPDIQGQVGVINAAGALKSAIDFRRVLVESQIRPITSRDTADSFLSSKFKPNSKVTLQIEQASTSDASWSELATRRLVDDGPGAIYFDKLSVQSIFLSDDERYQIVETYGANFIYSFGRRPQFVRISAVVVNGATEVIINGEARSMDWANAFIRRYNKHFRLNALVRRRRRCVLTGQDIVYSGYLLGMTSQVSVESQNTAQISINMVVSSQVFTAQNDSAIPGTLIGGNLYLPGRETPDDYFPRATIEQFFERDYKNVIKLEAQTLREPLDELIKTMLREEGAPGAKESDIEGAIASSSSSTTLVPVISDVSIDPILESSSFRILEDLNSYVADANSLEQAKLEWIETFSTNGQLSLGDNFFDQLLSDPMIAQSKRAQLIVINTRDGELASRLDGLRARVVRLNALSTQARAAYLAWEARRT